jgi:tetratricopeptide (TPR) repeat protein
MLSSCQSVGYSLWGRVAFLFLFCLAAPLTQRGWSQESVSLAGQIRNPDGRSIASPVNLRLETEEGLLVQTQAANPEGQFEFTDLRKKSYRLTVLAEGFQTLQQVLDLRTPASRVYINLFLTPAGKSKGEKGDTPSLTDQQAPKKAREEYSQGMRAFSKENYSKARDHLERAVAEYPCYARAQTQLAVTLIHLHASTHAEAPLRKSIECDPGYHEAHLVLGQILSLEKRFDESEKILSEGLRLSPGSWQFHYQLGVAHLGLGEYTKAEQDFQKVVSLNPNPPPEYHVKLADVYLAQKAYDRAYVEMQAYLQAQPNGRFAAKIRKIMQEMEAAGVLANSRPH